MITLNMKSKVNNRNKTSKRYLQTVGALDFLILECLECLKY